MSTSTSTSDPTTPGDPTPSSGPAPSTVIRVKPTQAPSAQPIPLHVLDQVYNFYIPLNLFFTPSSSTLNPTYFRQSLARALDRYPIVAASIAEIERNGEKVKVFVLDGSGVDLIWEERPEMRYADLSRTDYAALSPRGPLGNGDPKQTLLMVKLTKFSCGTICMALSASHRLCDCTSFTTFIKEWANQSRLEPSTSPTAPSPSSWERNPHMLFPRLSPGTEPTLPHGFTAPASPLSWAPQPSPAAPTVLLFNTDSLRVLKSNATPTEEGAWISTGDAITALLWRAISRAREEKIDREEVHMVMAVDGRSRSEDPKAKSYFGSLVLHVTHTLPKSALLSGPLAPVALGIRRSLDVHLTPAKAGNLLAFLTQARSMPMVADVGRGDMRVTNWTKYDLLGEACTFGGGMGRPWRVTLCKNRLSGPGHAQVFLVR